MKSHLLLEKAYIYPLPKKTQELRGCSFDDKKGYWVMNGTNTPFILEESAIAPTSKKCDIETGEDQKGE